jgi:hypothetical protein
MHPTFKEQGENCSIEFGLAYNSKWIDGVYQSSSWYHENGKNWVSRYDNPDDFNYNSQSNGVPDSSWILDNYLKGIHPGWYVDKNGNRMNHGWEDGEQNGTEYMMTQFFEKELFEKAGELIYESMRDAVLDFIKTNGGGK